MKKIAVATISLVMAQAGYAGSADWAVNGGINVSTASGSVNTDIPVTCYPDAHPGASCTINCGNGGGEKYGGSTNCRYSGANTYSVTISWTFPNLADAYKNHRHSISLTISGATSGTGSTGGTSTTDGEWFVKNLSAPGTVNANTGERVDVLCNQTEIDKSHGVGALCTIDCSDGKISNAYYNTSCVYDTAGTYYIDVSTLAASGSYTTDRHRTQVNVTVLDSDNDGLSDGLESQIGTDKTKYDTDLDNVGDGTEYNGGRNPLVNEPALLAAIFLLIL